MVYPDNEEYQSRRSSIGATIPSAIELRDRCRSEGNLLLVSSHNIDDNQATIVSLPPPLVTEYTESMSILAIFMLDLASKFFFVFFYFIFFICISDYTES